eukprot:1675301-Pyramimonas_sp.AAC.1
MSAFKERTFIWSTRSTTDLVSLRLSAAFTSAPCTCQPNPTPLTRDKSRHQFVVIRRVIRPITTSLYRHPPCHQTNHGITLSSSAVSSDQSQHHFI